MKQDEIDIIAAQIFHVSTRGIFQDADASVKTFYRRIAKWHLKKIGKVSL